MIAQTTPDPTSGGPGAAIIVVALAFYFIPFIVAALRKVPNVGSVFVLNAFLGWTVVGWIIALVMAARTVPPQYQPVLITRGQKSRSSELPPRPDL